MRISSLRLSTQNYSRGFPPRFWCTTGSLVHSPSIILFFPLGVVPLSVRRRSAADILSSVKEAIVAHGTKSVTLISHSLGAYTSHLLPCLAQFWCTTQVLHFPSWTRYTSLSIFRQPSISPPFAMA